MASKKPVKANSKKVMGKKALQGTKGGATTLDPALLKSCDDPAFLKSCDGSVLPAKISNPKIMP